MLWFEKFFVCDWCLCSEVLRYLLKSIKTRWNWVLGFSRTEMEKHLRPQKCPRLRFSRRLIGFRLCVWNLNSSFSWSQPICTKCLWKLISHLKSYWLEKNKLNTGIILMSNVMAHECGKQFRLFFLMIFGEQMIFGRSKIRSGIWSQTTANTEPYQQASKRFVLQIFGAAILQSKVNHYNSAWVRKW